MNACTPNFTQTYRGLLLACVATLVAACGGGDPFSTPTSVDQGGSPSAPRAASLSLLLSSPELSSAQDASVTVTALVRDSENNAVSGVGVTFSADSGVLDAQTSEPNIGNPVTDGTGRASVRLSVGPDQSARTIRVTAIAGDLEENVEVRVIDTRAANLVLIASSSDLPAQDDATVTITALARDASNNVVPGIGVTFSADSGVLVTDSGSARTTTDDSGRASVRLSPGPDLAERTIVVSAIAGDLEEVIEIRVVDRAPDPRVASLSLVTSSPELPSSGETPVLVTALVRDSNNNVVSNVGVTFSADSGVLELENGVASATTDEAGRAVARLSVGPDRSERTITVTAIAGDLQQTVDVQVVGTRASSLALTVSSAELPAQPDASVTITALARDASNAVVSGVDVVFSADSGVLESETGASSVITDFSGRARIQLSTGPDTSERTITVVATSGNLEEIIEIRVVRRVSDPRVASLALIVSSPDLPSSGDTPVIVTALVRDSNNNVVSDIDVTFSASSGVLQVNDGSGTAMTDLAGLASAELSVGPDPSNRPVTITATAGDLEETIDVGVVGTRLLVTGPTDVTLGESLELTGRLLDSAGRPIAGQAIQVTSSLGNPISSGSLTTSSAGEVRVTLTAAQGGTDDVEFRWEPSSGSPPLVRVNSIGISEEQIEFLAPLTGAEIALGATAEITVRRTSSGTPVIGEQLSFSSTRGTLSSLTAVTTATGEATVTVVSDTAGPAVLTVTQADGASVQRTIEFVALIPDSITLRASPFTLAPEQTSVVTAQLRDSQGNPVKNSRILFNLTDTTGGRLTSGEGVTDSTGQVSVVYEAGLVPSTPDGVEIRAYPEIDPAVEATIGLTVARRELFVTIGTDNTIRKDDTNSTYEKDFAIIVTDVDGVGVGGAQVNLRTVSLRYRTGQWVLVPPLQRPPAWVQDVSGTCLSEDLNQNGILDPGEDANGNGVLDPGNVATIRAADGSGGIVVTDSDGFGRAILTYPQDVAQWVEVAISARTGVEGTEFLDQRVLWLPIAQQDILADVVVPPGRVSPYGLVPGLCNPG